MTEKSKHVEKKWGNEEWLVNNEKYCGKILTLKQGFISSYHHHRKKDETFYVLRGLVYFKRDGLEMTLNAGESVRVRPGQIHQFASLAGVSKIIEISTHHEDGDTYRKMESRPIDTDELTARILGNGRLK